MHGGMDSSMDSNNQALNGIKGFMSVYSTLDGTIIYKKTLCD